MVRPRATDPLQNHLFGMREISHNTGPNHRPFLSGRRQGGLISFAGISLPEETNETVEIAEGTAVHVHHINAGRITTGECTIRHAVLPYQDAGFYAWFKDAGKGRNVPRKSFAVYHLKTTSGGPENREPGRIYVLHGCLPVTWQPSSELSADDGEVSIEELTMHVHEVKLVLPAPVIDNPFGSIL